MRRCIAAPLKTCTFWMAKRSPKQLPDLARRTWVLHYLDRFLMLFVDFFVFFRSQVPHGSHMASRRPKRRQKGAPG